jgi:hypothetical protein
VSERLDEIVRARFLVASLGEQEQTPWWRSQASRRSAVAGWSGSSRGPLEISIRGALAMHDAKLGGTGVYHLFRLPVSLEAGVHHVLARNDARVGALLESAPRPRPQTNAGGDGWLGAHRI